MSCAAVFVQVTFRLPMALILVIRCALLYFGALGLGNACSEQHLAAMLLATGCVGIIAELLGLVSFLRYQSCWSPRPPAGGSRIGIESQGELLEEDTSAGKGPKPENCLLTLAVLAEMVLFMFSLVYTGNLYGHPNPDACSHTLVSAAIILLPSALAARLLSISAIAALTCMLPRQVYDRDLFEKKSGIESFF